MGGAAESRLTQLHEGTPGLAWWRDRAVRRKSTSGASATGSVSRWVAIAVTDPHARETAESGAGSRNGSNRNKSGGRLGTKGRTREQEMACHEAARGRWGIAADGSLC